MRHQVRTSYLIRRAQLALFVSLADCLSDDKITPMQYMLLSLLRRSKDLSSADLARRFVVTPQSMNEAISELDRKGLIKRTIAPEHRKILRVSLTPEGRRLLNRCDARVDQMEDDFFKRLSKTEMKLLRVALGKLVSVDDDKERLAC